MFYVGEFGKYQFLQFFLQVLSALTAGLHMLSLVTVAAVPDHRCFIEGLDNSSLSTGPWNSSDILAAIPLKPSGELDSCHMYDPAAPGANSTIACTSYVYDTTYYKTSRTIDWNFVCDRRWMGAIVQTVFMLGVFTGAVTLGGLADKVGRKTVFCWSALFQLIIGVGVAFIPEYFSFMAARYLLGIVGSAGAYICGFVLTMELVGPSKRTVCGITFQVRLDTGLLPQHTPTLFLISRPSSPEASCWSPAGEPSFTTASGCRWSTACTAAFSWATGGGSTNLPVGCGCRAVPPRPWTSWRRA